MDPSTATGGRLREGEDMDLFDALRDGTTPSGLVEVAQSAALGGELTAGLAMDLILWVIKVEEEEESSTDEECLEIIEEIYKYLFLFHL